MGIYSLFIIENECIYTIFGWDTSSSTLTTSTINQMDDFLKTVYSLKKIYFQEYINSLMPSSSDIDFTCKHSCKSENNLRTLTLIMEFKSEQTPTLKDEVVPTNHGEFQFILASILIVLDSRDLLDTTDDDVDFIDQFVKCNHFKRHQFRTVKTGKTVILDFKKWI